MAFDQNGFELAEPPAANVDENGFEFASTALPVPAGGLLGESARTIPTIVDTTRGGAPISLPEGALTSTLGEIGQGIGETLTHPSPIPTPFEITKADKPLTAVGKEAVNLAVGIPQFFTSALGIEAAGAGVVAPTIVAGAFTADLLHGLGKKIKQTYSDWPDMTTAEKAVAVEDMIASGGMAALTGRAAIKGAGKFAEGYTPRGTGFGSPETIKPAGETYASTIRSDQGPIVEAGQIPQTSENLSGENLQLAPPIAPEPVVTRVEPSPPAEVIPPVQPPEITSLQQNWVRGESQRNSAGDKFFSSSSDIADNYGQVRAINPAEIPKNVLTVTDKPELADKIGYIGDPLSERVGTPKSKRFDTLAKKYAQDNGFDAIHYLNGTFGEPELHVFEKSEAIPTESQPPQVAPEIAGTLPESAPPNAPLETAPEPKALVEPTAAPVETIPSETYKDEMMRLLLSKSEELKTPATPVNIFPRHEEIHSRIVQLMDKAADWNTREYKSNKTKLAPKDEFDPEVSIGTINEIKRSKRVQRYVDSANNLKAWIVAEREGLLTSKDRDFLKTANLDDLQDNAPFESSKLTKKTAERYSSIILTESSPQQAAQVQVEKNIVSPSKVSSAFDDLVKEHAPKYEWSTDPNRLYIPGLEKQTTGLGTMGLAAKREYHKQLKIARRNAAREIGVDPDSMESVAGRAKALPKLQAWLYEQERLNLPAKEVPKLGAMEKGTGDLLKGQTEAFALTGEKGTDAERVAALKAKAEQDSAEAAAIAAKQQQTFAAISQGPGAASPGDVPPQAQIEQLASAFKNITSQKSPLSERVKQAFDFGRQRDLSRDLIGRTLSALKTSGDYLIQTWSGVNDVDPILKVKGQLSSDLELRGWRMRQAMKDMKQAVPDVKTREAISKWVDSGGDVESLRSAAETVPKESSSAYTRALQLTPEQKIFAEHIKSYFESRFQEAKDAGVLENGIEDYIHRIYPKDTPWRKGIINAIQNGVLNTRKPGLAMKRVFEFDADAEKAGLKPVGDFIPRVLDYEASLSKVIASREAVKRFTEIKMPDGRPMLDTAGIGVPIENAEGVREATLIKPSFKPGENQIGPDGKPTLNYRKDYQSRDYGALKKWKWATKDQNGNPIFVQGDVLIHPDAVHRIDALLQPSAVRKSPIGRTALAAGSTFKQTMLDFSGFHQVQIAIHGLEHKVNPFNLVKNIDAENPNVAGLLRGGVTLGGEHVGGLYQEGLVGRSLSRQIPGLGPLMETYHSWLFQNFIPRMKMTMALHALERNRARFSKELASGKMTEDALYYQTAKEANAAFGGLNYIMLERSKTAQDMARLILLAPDFLEARGRFSLQALTKLGGEQRMALLLGALTLYTTARLMNKALNDEYHNEPENLFSIVHNGKSYSIRTVQGDVLRAIEEPVKFWLHRLNPTLTRPLFELLSGRDEFGRRRDFWQVMGDTISNIVPISMRFSREQSIWTSLLNAFGGSVRRNSEIGRIYQAANEWKKKNGIRTEPGEFIYDPSKDIYRQLKLAILDGDTGAAALEYKKLIDAHLATPKQTFEHFHNYANSPFSGSQANETKFVKSLSTDQLKSYQAAKQEKQRILQGFQKAAGGIPISIKPERIKPLAPLGNHLSSNLTPGQTIARGGRMWTVTGFDSDGEALVQRA